MFNLTKRQLLCFGSGATIGLPLFFILKKSMNPSVSTLIMVFSMLPFFLFAIYEKNGLPLEKHVRNIVLTRFIRSRQRPYTTDNFYTAIAGHNKLKKGGFSDCQSQQGSKDPTNHVHQHIKTRYDHQSVTQPMEEEEQLVVNKNKARTKDDILTILKSTPISNE